MQKELVSSLLLEDLTLTDLYNETENFKKSVIYGFDSLAKLATEIDTGVKEGLARPDLYQLISVFEPVKSRIVLIGRTEQMEKNIDAFAPIFVAQTWSGYLDNLLSEACFKLSTLNKARLPSHKELKAVNTGELAVLSKDLATLVENQKLVDECLQASEQKLNKIDQNLQQLKIALKPSEKFKIGMIEAIFQINTENMKTLPTRIKEFRKEWKTICRRIGNIREHVEKEFNERKPESATKKRGMLKSYPFVAAFSAILLIIGLQPQLAPWWRMIFPSIALISQIFYVASFYRKWSSFNKVTKYPNQAFSMVQLFLLTLIEAIYGYVITEDVLTPT